VRLVFFGTPQFAVPSLEIAAASGHEILAVITQPDRPKGRAQELALPPVKSAALRLGLPVHQPAGIRTPEFLEFLRALRPDAMAVVGYGKMIPQAILDIPPLGIINVHASLLPEYRGAAPIQWAIANGAAKTGVTTMRIDAGLDTGDILLAAETEIGPEETAVELGERLAAMGAGLLRDTLEGLRQGRIVPMPQDSSRATLAPILKKEDGRIDWNWPAARIHDRVRGLLPWPGCYTGWRGRTLQIWETRVAEPAAGAGAGSLEASKSRLFAACGEGTRLELLEVQLEGKRRMSSGSFLNGYHLEESETLETNR